MRRRTQFLGMAFAVLGSTFLFVFSAIGRAEPPAEVPEVAGNAVEAAEETQEEEPAWMAEYVAHVEADEEEAAIAVCNRILERDPQNVEALFRRGITKVDMLLFDEGMADLRTARAIAPDHAGVWRTIGDAYCAGTKQNLTKAIAAYDKAIELDPSLADAWYGRGLALYFQGRLQGSVDQITRAIELNDECALYYLQRGQAYHEMDQCKAAIQDFSKGIDCQPDKARAVQLYDARAHCHVELAQLEEAKHDYDELVRLEPDSPWVYERRVPILLKLGDYDAASKDILAAIERTPDDAGKNYKPNRDVELSAEALQHGEEQMKRLFADRPQMGAFCKPGDKLWNWAVRKFAGEDIGEPIYWDFEEPYILEAEHAFPTGSQVGVIRIRPIDPAEEWEDHVAFEKLWQCLVFELHNIVFKDEFEGLNTRVDSSDVGREALATEFLNIERHASERTRAFYGSFFLDCAKSAGLKLGDAGSWYVGHVGAADTPASDLPPEYVKYYVNQYELGLGERLSNAGQFAHAKATFQGLLDKSTKLRTDMQARLHYSLGVCQLAENENETALDSFRKVAAADARWAEEWLLTGAFERRYAPVRGIEEGPRREAAAFCLRANAFATLTRTDEALADLERAESLNPNLAAVHNIRQQLHSYSGEHQLAIQDLTSAIQLEPNVPELYQLRAEQWNALDEKQKALDDMHEYVRLSDTNNDSLLMRSQMKRQYGDEAGAAADLAKILESDPAYAPAYVPSMYLAFDRGDFTAALADAERAVQLDANLLVARVYARTEIGELNKALEDANECVRLNPNRHGELCQRCELLLRLRDFQRALDDAETVLWLDHNSAEGFCMRGQAHAGLGKYLRAMADFDQCVAIDPEIARAWQARAKFLSECPDPEFRNTAKAIADATKACELTEWEDHKSISTLAACHAENGDFPKAIEWETKALEVARGDWKKQHEANLEFFQAGKTLRQATGG